MNPPLFEGANAIRKVDPSAIAVVHLRREHERDVLVVLAASGLPRASYLCVSASLRLGRGHGQSAMLVHRDDVSASGTSKEPPKVRLPSAALDDYRVRAGPGLDFEPFLDFRLQECVESVLSPPAGIDLSSHSALSLRGEGLAKDEKEDDQDDDEEEDASSDVDAGAKYERVHLQGLRWSE